MRVLEQYVVPPVSDVQPARHVNNLDQQLAEVAVNIGHELLPERLGQAAWEGAPQVFVSHAPVPAIHSVDKPGQKPGQPASRLERNRLDNTDDPTHHQVNAEIKKP
jgi:hypothetical protein